MATQIYLNFVRRADVPTAPLFKKLHLKRDKVIAAKMIEVGGNTLFAEWDFENAPDSMDTIDVPQARGYRDGVYRYLIKGSTAHIWVAVGVPDDTEIPVPDYQEIQASTQQAVFIAHGETNALESTYNVGFGWMPGALSETDKKNRCIEDIKAWRLKKKAWLLESPEYADLIPEITKHLGYWLRAADYAIYYEFNRKNTNVNGAYGWDVIEAMAREAAKGPLSLDPDGDGAYNVEFFQAFRGLIYGSSAMGGAIPPHPNGPSAGTIWLNTEASPAWASPSDVQRQTLTYSLITSQASRFTGLTAAYNPTTAYWSS